MSHRNYRKLQREKEEHVAVLTKRRDEKLNYVSPITIEENERKTSRINLFQDLRTACNLELGYGRRFLSYVEVTETDLYGKKSKMQILNPLIEFVNTTLSNSKLNFGFMEKKAVAHLFETCKKSSIFDSATITTPEKMNLVPLGGGSFTRDAVIAIVNMARYKISWIRNPDLWKPPNHCVEMQLHSLIQHLFVKYPIPDFFNKVWAYDGDEVRIHQEWYINIGNGENIRHQKKLPIPLTKRVAHCMMQAPSNCTVNQAIRWGQVMAMGGNETIANGVNNTRLAENFGDEDFWITVIKFFIDSYPFLETHQYVPIYDYIQAQKFAPFRYIEANGERHGQPPQPNFSMKGRDPNTLLLAVQRWHNEMNIERARYNGPNYEIKSAVWKSCGIKGMVLKEDDITYTIMELLTTEELWDEGKAMHHCVSSYSSYCVNGSSAIYSLSAKTEDKNDKNNFVVERLVTLEIRPSSKDIVQARKLMNAKPNSEDMRIIKLWANKVGLTSRYFIN